MKHMRNHRFLLPLLWLIATGFLSAAEVKVENWDNGKPKVKYEVNAEGRKHGKYMEYYETGKIKVSAKYKDGLLIGRYTTYYEDGKEHVRCEYKNGKRNGKYIERNPKRKVIITAYYKDDLLHGVYKLAKPAKVVPEQIVEAKELLFVRGKLAHPKPLNYIRDKLAKIDPAGPARGVVRRRARPPARKKKKKKKKKQSKKKPENDFGGDFSPAHILALQRLRAYRFICDIPYADLVLDAELNKYGVAGAKICDAIGHLDHRPKNPGWPEDKYKYAYYATSHANLHMSGMASGDALLAPSVDGYMNDSDKRNIDRVGHRRWCLNPGMLKVGFGAFGHFSAMMAHNNSRDPAPDWERIYYPARGFMPIRYFSPVHAWCVLLNPKKHARPDKSSVKVKVYPLDEKLRLADEALSLNYFNVETSGFGHNWAVIFRPQGVSIRNGSRYWVEVDGVKSADGKDAQISYMVEFVNLAGSTGKRSKKRRRR